MKYIKPLIDKNLEQFRQNIEASLYSKLSEKLDEVKTDVASDIYNEGRCVPCSQKMNEETKKDCDEMYRDCMEEVEAAGGDGETHGGKERCKEKKRKCEEKIVTEGRHEDGDDCGNRCNEKIDRKYGNKQTLNGVDRNNAYEKCLNDCYARHSY